MNYSLCSPNNQHHRNNNNLAIALLFLSTSAVECPPIAEKNWCRREVSGHQKLGYPRESTLLSKYYFQVIPWTQFSVTIKSDAVEARKHFTASILRICAQFAIIWSTDFSYSIMVTQNDTFASHQVQGHWSFRIWQRNQSQEGGYFRNAPEFS